MQKEDKKVKQNSKIDLYELVNFLRDNRDLITNNQALALIFTASRNGLNADYQVNQKMLANDLLLDARHTRRVLAPLIDKGVIKVSKRNNKKVIYNDYHIDKNYAILLKESHKDNLTTGRESPVEDHNDRTFLTLSTGRTSPVVNNDTYNIKINNKINNKPPIIPLAEEGDFLPNGFIVEKVSNDDSASNRSNYWKHFKQFEEYSESFLTLCKEYPRKIYQSEKDFCWKLWLDFNYEKSAQQIIDNVMLRKAKDAYWIEMIANNNQTRIKSLKNFILDKFWEEPIKNNEEIKNGKNIKSGKQHSSASSKLQAKLRAQLQRINATQH